MTFKLSKWRRAAIHIASVTVVGAAAGYVAGRLGWHKMLEAMNSGFLVGVVGAGISSYAGAYAAQWIVERKNLREEMLRDIRHINTGIMIAFGICNTLVTLKKQHIKRMKEYYDSQCGDFLTFQAMYSARQLAPGAQFLHQVDYQTLSMPGMPTELLQSQIFEKLSLIGRPLILTMQLIQTIDGLAESVGLRNRLIEEMRVKGDQLGAEYRIHKYFGTPSQDGHVDRNYPDSISAIYNQTDDGIIFSKLLYEDLIDHGEQVKRKFESKFGGDAPPIGKPRFIEAERLGLIPDLKDYADWVNLVPNKAGPSA